jgi:catabolite regulation protein CreA
MGNDKVPIGAMAWPRATGTTGWVSTLKIVEVIHNVLITEKRSHENISLLSEKWS